MQLVRTDIKDKNGKVIGAWLDDAAFMKYNKKNSKVNKVSKHGRKNWLKIFNKKFRENNE